MGAAGCCICVTITSVIAVIIAMIVITVQVHKPDDCSQFTSCYDCMSGPCGETYDNHTLSSPKCTTRCYWDFSNQVYFQTSPICTSTTYPAIVTCPEDVTKKQPSLFIFFIVLAGLIPTLSLCCRWCVFRKTGADERQALLDKRAASSKTCGNCSHDKHHGSNCYVQVDNRNYQCTCKHSHHKPSICKEQVSYIEYKTERKLVSVKKTKTTYRQETRSEPVVKTRMKQVDQGGWEQVPYGPGNGTHAVYRSRMVSVPETYTVYESRSVTVPHHENYYVDEWQNVQTPITKYRQCGCNGSNCGCASCVPKVNCGCNTCDCGICTGRKNSAKDSKNRTCYIVIVAVLFAVNFLAIFIYGCALAKDGSTKIITANQFNKPEWHYDTWELSKIGVYIGWGGVVGYIVTLAGCIFAFVASQ